MSSEMLFGGWTPLIRTAVIAACAYPGMLLMVRISGHRTLAQLNAFDLIVTVALGSTLASVITSKDVALAQGLLAFALLILMQYMLSKAAVLSAPVERVVNGQPVLLARRGTLLHDAMAGARITADEIHAVVRSEGIPALDQTEAVVLETNGKLSVIKRAEGNAWSLESVPGYGNDRS